MSSVFTQGTRRFAALVVAVIAVLGGAELFARSVVDARTGSAGVTKDEQVERQIRFVGDRTTEGSDIVVAGTSMAGVGIDPAVLAERTTSSAFNAALGCANPLVVADWIPNFVAPELRPSVVVLAIPPSDLDPESCPRDWTAIDMLTTPAAERVRPDVRTLLREHSSLWRQRSWLRKINNLPLLVVDVPWTWDVTFRPDGFWQVDAWAPTDPDTYLLEPHRTQITIDPARELAIATTVADLKALGSEVVIAEMPMANRWIDHLGDSLVSYEEAEAHLRGIAESTGAVYLKSPEQFHENELFIDEGHMTPDGAAAYSRWLGTRLAEVTAQ